MAAVKGTDKVSKDAGASKDAAPKVATEPRLKKIYREQIAPELIKEFNFKTPMQTPRLQKIVVSMGVGEALQNKKLLDAAIDDITLITGQKAIKTKAKKSIAYHPSEY